MTLVVSAQDIRGISLGLVEDGVLRQSSDVVTRPEEYLQVLDDTLRSWGISLESIDSIVVVSGPGSFTSTRVSTTLVNGLAFAKSVPIISLENPDRLSLTSLVTSQAYRDAAPVTGYATPKYDRPPMITLPKRNS